MKVLATAHPCDPAVAYRGTPKLRALNMHPISLPNSRRVAYAGIKGFVLMFKVGFKIGFKVGFEHVVKNSCKYASSTTQGTNLRTPSWSHC